MKTIDLNCDVGEGVGNEAVLMPYLSSCNISCGLHAGDDATIREVIQMAKANHVAIGAHPSFDDRANFGRREMYLPLDELRQLVRDQVRKMQDLTRENEITLTHVKPHGALYNMAARSTVMSHAIIDALLEVNPSLKFMGLAESEMAKASVGRIAFIAEGFADRKYADQTTLKSRTEEGLMTDMKQIEAQLKLMLKGQIETDKGRVPLHIQSLCLHGDTLGAEPLIAHLHDVILSMGIEIKAV